MVKPQSNEPPIECSHSKLVAPDKLLPHPRNPNTHPEGQVALLAKIIEERGWRLPIVVSSLSGYVIRGHCRLLAARALGLKRVPVDVQTYATPEEELADLVADNRIAELAAWDDDGLSGILADLDVAGLDMELTGYDSEALVTMLAASAPDMSEFKKEHEDQEDTLEKQFAKRPAGDQYYFYVEYYGEPERFEQLQKLLQLRTDHEIDKDWFEALINAAATT